MAKFHFSVKIDKLPSHNYDKSFGGRNSEKDIKLKEQQNFHIKTEIKIENHDDLDGPIYKDSVSFFYYISIY